MSTSITMGWGDAAMPLTGKGGKTTFSITDPLLDVSPMGMAFVNFGDDPNGPCAVIYNVLPGVEVAAHYHNTEQCFVVLEGSIRIGRTWYGPGTVRVQDSGSVYGPSLIGPDGCRAVSFYGDRSELPDQFASERDRRKSEAFAAKYWGQ